MSEFNKLKVSNPADIKLINSINLSKEDYRQLIADAKQFATLSNQQAALSASNPLSPESLQNMRELQRISSDLNSLKSTIDARNRDVYQNAQANGLDTSTLDRLSAHSTHTSTNPLPRFPTSRTPFLEMLKPRSRQTVERGHTWMSYGLLGACT